MAKIVDIQIQGNRCYYRLNSCPDNEFQSVLEYKSWLFKSWKFGIERKFFSFVYINRSNEKVIWSYVGFAPILIRYLQSLGYLVNGKELFRAKEITIGNMLYKLYDYQTDAVDAWIRLRCCGCIKISTGGGKTITTCEIIRRMKVRTIICIHTSDLLINAWLKTLVEQFGDGIKQQIGVVGGGLSKNDRKQMRIISDMSYDANIKQDIVIATAQSLLNHLNELSNERFGLLVWDECQHVSAEQFNKVASSIRAVYRMGTTATINRPDGTSPLIYGLLGDVVYRITIKELIRKGILVNPVFNCIVIDDKQVQSDIRTSGYTKLELSRYVKKKSASSVIKKDYILKLAKSLCDNKKKFIMYSDFVNDNENGVFTRDYYVKTLNMMNVRCIGVSADMSGSEREKVFNMLENNKLDGLIFGKLGAEGINIPKVDSVIMNNATKSTILYPQRCGRAFRTVKTDVNKKNAFVYEIILNTPMEIRWSNDCFWEYEQEGYEKEKIYVRG